MLLKICGCIRGGGSGREGSISPDHGCTRACHIQRSAAPCATICALHIGCKAGAIILRTCEVIERDRCCRVCRWHVFSASTSYRHGHIGRRWECNKIETTCHLGTKGESCISNRARSRDGQVQGRSVVRICTWHIDRIAYLATCSRHTM